MAVVRVRQHVNPLSDKYQQKTTPPDWAKVFARPEQPLHIDIGCGKGIFVTQMAALQPDWNFLGLEIREPLVDQALRRRDEAGLTNLHFLFCNVNTSLQGLIESFPMPSLQRVSIQFPDPWFKKRHQKRRVVQPELVNAIATSLPAHGQVVLQSDVQEVAEDMVERFSEHTAFDRTASDWLPTSPFPAQTDRERVTLEKGQPVYRAIFTRI
ncbi:tRNA (guanosine(46)-N7)-methyltransferase TrmB [Pseudanabaena sp. FACHB-2040]|uniref:tRNA (guanosine(46)-N7)-methyltransferase TrmB n=1 Tax=Pseudanabaena sp. FACHB-2040 TaxID=2692859 RepID=UPI001683A3B0|nr:tRNA (guanosine(46)-N7)-methyltransferase TrmB [Pseudanabaena sp. FACHB-2040]MBD2256592.1 tRNA (guanosine(46)-N7)-methyltransferase TrmB [Pseudanabaena sp. FACHB-2040]